MKKTILGRRVPKGIMLACTMITAVVVLANPHAAAQNNTFVVDKPNYELSPHTGMTRKHWEDAALYLLAGAFSHIAKLDDPMVFPRQLAVTNTRTNTPPSTEMLAGLSRTLIAASVLLKANPELEINSIKVADYYRHHLVKLTNSSSSTYVSPRSKEAGVHQNLVEFGALAISLFVAPEILWEPLTKAQKDALAVTMLSYGDGPTAPSHEKFFNITILSFFKAQGYAVNEALLREYLQKTLEHYRGDGWYNDNPAYDYYSMSAFQTYAILWSEFFGNQHYPDVAKKFIANFRAMNDSYPYLFSREGEMLMWGRNIASRFASIAPLPLMGLVDDPTINYGWLRRISSGNLLQFLQHPDFLHERVPALGFYGAFEPAVQSYSVRGSSYWSLHVFLALLMPTDNAFWAAKENEGPWEIAPAKNAVHNQFQANAEMLITNYADIGATEVRAWCNVRSINNAGLFCSTENYNRLAYNSAFPWQVDGVNGEVAMNYIVKNKKGEWEALQLFEFKEFSDGVYYRSAVLETDDKVRLNLADIPLPNGILRIDENLSTTATEFRLGHYALPALGSNIRRTMRRIKNHDVQMIDNGEYQLAMIPLQGWDGMIAINTIGLNPVSNQSTIINVAHQHAAEYEQPVIHATLMLWKKSGEKWANEELLPVRSIERSKKDNLIVVSFNDGSKKTLKSF